MVYSLFSYFPTWDNPQICYIYYTHTQNSENNKGGKGKTLKINFQFYLFKSMCPSVRLSCAKLCKFIDGVDQIFELGKNNCAQIIQLEIELPLQLFGLV